MKVIQLIGRGTRTTKLVSDNTLVAVGDLLVSPSTQPTAVLTPWCNGHAQQYDSAQSACCVCGRATPTDRPFTAACIVAGNTAWGDDKSDQADPGYMGWYPVGPDCARRLQKQGVQLRQLPAIEAA